MLRHIGISGKMASGKTKLADYLCNNFGYVRYSFAQPMKELEKIHQKFKKENLTHSELIQLLMPYLEVLNVPFVRACSKLIDLYDEVPLVVPKNREFLQKLGTDVIRELNTDAWLEYALHQVEKSDKPVVIDDVRFINEAIGLKNNNFFVIRLSADEEIRRSKIIELYGIEALAPARLSHPSEVSLDNFKDFDLVLTNNYDDRLDQYAEALQIILSKGR